jgi:hypothetical protein
VTFLLWPGGWLRGGYLETYGVLAATVVFKNSTAFGGKLTGAGIYNGLFSGHEALLVLTLLCFVGILALLASRRASAPMIVFASYNLVAFALGVANHFRLSTYISEFLLFFIVATGLVAADIQRAFLQGAFVRRMSVLALSLLLIVGCFSEWRSRESALAFRPWLEPIFSGIREKVPTGETILVTDDWEALWLYLPQYGFEPTEAKDSAVPRSPSSSVQTKYFLFDGEVQPPNGSFALATFSTYSGRTEVLWKLAPQRGSSDGEAQHPQ